MTSPKPWSEPDLVDTELLEILRNGVVEFDESTVVSVCQTIVDRRMDAYMAIFEGLVAGMDEVGRLFDLKEYFVPELLMSADTLYAGLDILRPHVIDEIGSKKDKGEVVIGAIEGDIHDIGKNMLKMVFDVAGYTIHDMGCDVAIPRFLKKIRNTKSPLVCISVTMTTCFRRVNDLVKGIRQEAPDTIIMIGGASINEDSMIELGGDGTAENAHQALSRAISLLEAFHTVRSY